MPDVETEATPGLAASIAAEKAYLDSITSPDSPANIERNTEKNAETQPELGLEKVETPTVKAVIAKPKKSPTDSTPKPTVEAADDEEEGDEPIGEDDETDDQPREDVAAASDDVDDEDTAEFPAVKAEAKDDDFNDALEKHGVVIKLDDIKDPVARKFIETRMQQMEKGFTRAMQDARSYRKDEIAFRSEQRFQQEHPVEDVVSRLLANPELLDQVNERLAELESPTARKAHDVVVRDQKAQARTLEEESQQKAAQRLERGEQVERYAVRAAEKAGVPYELGIAEAIVALVLSRGEDGDVTRAEVDQIIKDKAEKYQRSIRAHKREDRKKYIQQKAEDAKNGGLKIKPGVGAAPGIGKKPLPANDDEFVAAFLAGQIG